MYGWVKQSEDTDMPSWMKEMLVENCRICGAPMWNYYNESGECTDRKCENPVCPGYVGQKLLFVCNILKVKGIGEKTCLSIAKRCNPKKSHLEALPDLLRALGYAEDAKPRIMLSTLLQMACIPGIDAGWLSICAPYGSVTELCEKYSGKHSSNLSSIKESLLEAEKLFDIAQPIKYDRDPLIVGEVMMTGTIPGCEPRENFIAAINQTSNGLIKIGVCGLRKSRVLALIKTADAKASRKVEAARYSNTPIMTPDEFISWVTTELKRRMMESDT